MKEKNKKCAEYTAKTLQQPGVEKIEDLKGISCVRSNALFPHLFFCSVQQFLFCFVFFVVLLCHYTDKKVLYVTVAYSNKLPD